MFFDLCEGGSRIADLESGRARDVHASTVSPVMNIDKSVFRMPIYPMLSFRRPIYPMLKQWNSNS